MLRLSLAFVLAAGFVAGIAGHADAAKRANSFIILHGCAHFQVPACTIISSGGQTYNLVGASPPVPLNVGVTVVGTKSGDIGICFATSIKVVKWTRDKLRCPLN
jgi:hypothetical protein